MNYDRIYEYRFKGIDKVAKQAVWKEISLWIYERMGKPRSVLDPAAGEMEFLKSIPAEDYFQLRNHHCKAYSYHCMEPNGIWQVSLE